MLVPLQGVCDVKIQQLVSYDTFNRLPIQLQQWWLVLCGRAKQHSLCFICVNFHFVHT